MEENEWGGGDVVLAPDKAFTLLGNETRIRILQTLGKADGALSFTDLRDRVGIQQGAQFNYHLKKLMGHFVKNTDEGYVLREAGNQVMRAILAGAITEDPSFGPTEIESRCPYCGGDAEVWYQDELFTARCTRCDGAVTSDEEIPRGTFLRYELPPASLQNRTPDEVLATAHRLYDSKITAMMEGVCSECGGITRFSFDICPDHELDDDDLCSTCQTRHQVWVEATCRNCRYTRQFVLWFAVVTNPAVVAFYDKHGVPWDRVPFAKLTWENSPYVADIAEDVLSEDPLRVRVTIQLAGSEIHTTIDDNLNIIDKQTEVADGD